MRPLAAEEALEAAKFRSSAGRARSDEERAQVVGRDREGRARQRAADQRVRERVQRRQQRARSGVQRFRPGPGRISASPGMAVTAPLGDDSLQPQVRALARALADGGPTDRRDLASRVGARHGGPAVFRQALGAALAERLIECRADGRMCARERE